MTSFLANAFWQLPLLTVAGLVAARLLRPFGPLVQYRLWLSVLVLQLLIPIASAMPSTWLQTLLSSFEAPGQETGQVTVLIGPATAMTQLHVPETLRATVILFYLIVTTLLTVRLVWRSAKLRTLRRRSTQITLTPTLETLWTFYEALFDTHAQLVESPDIPGPMTIGLRKKLLLLPESMLQALPPEELHAILAHEFAHMRRNDFATNLAFQILTLPIAFHPAMWFTRDRLVESRELICDRMAAAHTGPAPYTRSLLRLAARIVAHPSTPHPHAIGVFDAHSLERRLMNLTKISAPLGRTRRLALTAATVALTTLTCGTAVALRIQLNPALPQETSTPAHPIRISGGVAAGNIESRAAPVYPADAKAAGIQGAVVLHALIGTDGKITSLTVISGPAELSTSAIAAVSQWVYKPYLLNGEPTAVDTTITVNYSLNK